MMSQMPVIGMIFLSPKSKPTTTTTKYHHLTTSTLRAIAKTSGLIASIAFLSAPLCGPNAALVYVSAIPFTAVAALLFMRPEI